MFPYIIIYSTVRAMFTNININTTEEQFPYIVEYQQGISPRHLTSKYTSKLEFWDGGKLYTKQHNNWNEYIPNPLSEYLPSTSTYSTITLYFPEHSVDTYKNGVTYALNVGTWVHDEFISLGSFIFNRLDAVACDRIKTFLGGQYLECISFDIVNPFEIIYGDNWSEFRSHVCGEVESSNTEGSILYITLHPVEECDTGYRKDNEFVGGQNSINISKKVQEYLRVELNTNLGHPLGKNEEPSFIINTLFNHIYEGDITEYLKETYNLSSPKIRYEMVIGNENDLYAVIDSGIIEPQSQFVISKSQITSQNFSNWSGWIPGISVVASLSIFDEDNNSVLYLLSNKIPLTQDIFKYFVGDDFVSRGYHIHNVNLEELDMQVLNIDAVNKIETKVIQMSRPEDTKSNIIQPVFFRTVESASIAIHPQITETICINLDSYKSKVNTFILQVAGVSYPEIGRVASGVLFKVVGNKLPKENTSGTYYVLNEDAELVTMGKYNYN